MTRTQVVNPKVIKRYANRKLYDTEESKYITLKEVVSFVVAGREVQIIENKTKIDVTAKTLIMALVETEKDVGGQTAIIGDIFRAGGLASYVAGITMSK